jgi:hypothetical protein
VVPELHQGHDVVDRGLNGAFHETLPEKPEQESNCSTLCVGMEREGMGSSPVGKNTGISNTV